MRQDDEEPEVDNGIRSSNIGSFMPEGTYRPVPIVWFAGAYILQSLALVALFGILISKGSLLIIASSALATFGIGRMTFQRGMATAAKPWQIATVAMLLANFLLVVLGALARSA